jgi:hypothetical protein
MSRRRAPLRNRVVLTLYHLYADPVEQFLLCGRPECDFVLRVVLWYVGDHLWVLRQHFHPAIHLRSHSAPLVLLSAGIALNLSRIHPSLPESPKTPWPSR